MRSLPDDTTANTHIAAPCARTGERRPQAGRECTSLMPNPSFSRRAFIGGGLIAGALTFLGSIVSPNGTVVNAYADEAGNTSFSIYVLGRDEIPVMAMRKTDSGNVPVAGVKVTITSYYNNKQVTVVTGDDGFAPAHIRDLSFQCEEADASSYTFHGSVSASCDGYRDVRFIKEYFESAVPPADDGSRPNVLELPMEIDDGSSYLLNVSMDEVDILHSSEPMRVGDYNDVEHTVTVEVARTQGAADTTVSLIVDSTEWASATATRDASNPKVCTASFTDYFLSKISAGQKLRVRFAAAGEPAKTATLPVEFEPGLVFAQASNKLQVSPCIGIVEIVERPSLFTMAWLFGQADTMSIGFPVFPLEVFDDAAGNLGLCVTLFTWDPYKKKDGVKADPNEAFKWAGGKWMSSGWKSWKENTFGYAVDKYNQALDQAKHGFGCSGLSSMITVNFTLSLMAYCKSEFVDVATKTGDTKGSGFIGLNIRVGTDISLGTTITIGVFPIFFSLEFSLSLQVRLGFAVKFKNYLEDMDWSFPIASGVVPIVVVFYVSGAFTAGIGLRGVVGVGFRGFASFTSTVSKTHTDVDTSFTAVGQLGAQLFIQLFILYKSILICAPLERRYPEAKAAFDSSDLGRAPTELDLTGAKMIPQASLKKMSEFTAAAAVRSESTLTAVHGDKIPDDVLTTMPETFERSRALFTGAPLVASGPASASGFASPYGALDDEGEVLLGASGTSDLAATGSQADFRTVKTYNPRLGLVPVEQEILYDGTFSNSHVRTFVGSTAYTNDPEKNTVMGRLVTVTRPDNAGESWTCSRVHVRPWDAGERRFGDEQVISFTVNDLEAKNRFDVDFDLDVIELNGEVLLAMAVTSVALEKGEVIDAEKATDRQFVTFLVWSVTGKYLKWSKSLYSLLVDDNLSTFQPRALFQGKGDYNSSLCCFYYQRKEVETGIYQGIYVSPYFTSDAWPLVADKPGDGLQICLGNPDKPVERMENFEVASIDRVGTMYPGFVYTMRIVVAQVKGDGNVTVNAISFDGEMATNWDTLFLSNVATIVPMGSQDTQTLFAYTLSSDVPEKKKNHVITCSSNQQQLSAGETSGYSSDSDVFASADGKRLYTVRLSEGTSTKLDDKLQALVDAGAQLSSSVHYDPQTGANYGGASTTSDVAEPVYQLLESRWIESVGAYHEFYPIARLSFAPDNTAILSSNNGQRDFVMASLTGLPDMEHAEDDVELDVKSDIYHVAVPDVVAIQCEGVSTESTFAAAGDTVAFQVDVSNTGNCLVNGFTVTLRDDSGNVVEQNVYSDLREYLQESEDNQHPVRDESGNPTYDEDGNMVSKFVEDIRDTSGILWPGFLRTYRFTFTMPEGYEGQTSFTVQVSDPRSNPFANELSADNVAAAVLAGNGGPSMPEHLQWLSADDFAETLFGASLQTICDPRRLPFSVEQKAVSEAVASSFSAVPAVYQTDEEIDGGGYVEPDKGNGGGAGDGGTSGGGSGATGGTGSTNTNASTNAKKAKSGTPNTGDDNSALKVAGLAAAAVAAGVAGRSAFEGKSDD